MNYFDTVFALIQFHKYSPADIENMIPFERDIYVEMLSQHLEKQRLEAQQN